MTAVLFCAMVATEPLVRSLRTLANELTLRVIPDGGVQLSSLVG